MTDEIAGVGDNSGYQHILKRRTFFICQPVSRQFFSIYEAIFVRESNIIKQISYEKRDGVAIQRLVKIDFARMNYYNINCANVPEMRGFYDTVRKVNNHVSLYAQNHSRERFPPSPFLLIPHSGTAYR